MTEHFPTFEAAAGGISAAWRRHSPRFRRLFSRLYVVSRKVAKVALVVVIVFLTVHAILTLVWSRQVEHRLDELRARGEWTKLSDLVMKPVPENENAAIIYKEAIDQYHAITQEHRDIAGFISAFLSYETPSPVSPRRRGEEGPQSLEDNARIAVALLEPIEPLLKRAQEKPHCVFPEDMVEDETSWRYVMPLKRRYVMPLKNCTDVLCAHALLLSIDRKSAEAIDRLRVAVETAESLSRSPLHTSFFARTTIINQAAASARVCMSNSDFSPDQLGNIRRMFASITLQPGFESAIRSERAATIWWFDECKKRSPFYTECSWAPDYEGPSMIEKARDRSLAYLWRPVHYKDQLVNLEQWDKRMQMLSLPYRETARLYPPDGNPKLPWYAFLTRSADTYLPRVWIARDIAQAQIALTIATAAVQTYKGRFGQYPDSLEDASKKIGWTIPDDPFSGKPLCYRRSETGFTIYSWYFDLHDNGGKTVEELGPGNDADLVCKTPG